MAHAIQIQEFKQTEENQCAIQNHELYQNLNMDCVCVCDSKLRFWKWMGAFFSLYVGRIVCR